MYPELFTIGGFTVNSYGVMVAFAFFIAYLITSRELKRKGERPEMAQEMLTWVALCSIAGAKLFFVAENFSFEEIAANPVATVFARNGLTFYGGLFGGFAAGLYVAHKNGACMWKVFDAVAPGLALAYAIGRIGCLLVGDDYGTASGLPWAMAFPNGFPPVEFAVHPTQAYETLSMTAVFLILWKLRTAQKPDGRLFSIYLLLAGAERFFVEFLRCRPAAFDSDGFLVRCVETDISAAQIISLAIIAAGTAKLWTLSQKR